MNINRRFISLASTLLILFTNNILINSQTTKTIGATRTDKRCNQIKNMIK